MTDRQKLVDMFKGRLPAKTFEVWEWDVSDPTAEWLGVTFNKYGAVVELDVSNGDLTGELNMSGLDALEVLIVENNQLTSLDVSANHVLRELYCSNNQLTCINFPGSRSLESLWYSRNPLGDDVIF